MKFVSPFNFFMISMFIKNITFVAGNKTFLVHLLPSERTLAPVNSQPNIGVALIFNNLANVIGHRPT